MTQMTSDSKTNFVKSVQNVEFSQKATSNSIWWAIIDVEETSICMHTYWGHRGHDDIHTHFFHKINHVISFITSKAIKWNYSQSNLTSVSQWRASGCVDAHFEHKLTWFDHEVEQTTSDSKTDSIVAFKTSKSKQIDTYIVKPYLKLRRSHASSYRRSYRWAYSPFFFPISPFIFFFFSSPSSSSSHQHLPLRSWALKVAWNWG